MKFIRVLILIISFFVTNECLSQAIFSFDDLMTLKNQPTRIAAINWLKNRGFIFRKSEFDNEYYVYPSQYDNRHDYGDATVVIEKSYSAAVGKCRSFAYYTTAPNWDIILLGQTHGLGFKKFVSSEEFIYLKRGMTNLIIRKTTIKAKNYTDIPITFVRIFDENSKSWDD